MSEKRSSRAGKSNLKYFGVPWLLIHETPLQKCSSRSTSRPLPTKSKQENTSKGVQLSFIQHTDITFTPEELEEISMCMENNNQRPVTLTKSPSKLQKIKMMHFESAQEPLAIDLEPSEAYVVPTAPNEPSLSRCDSLISVTEDPSDVDVLERAKLSVLNLKTGYETNLEPSPEVTQDDLKEHVWNFARGKNNENAQFQQYLKPADCSATRGRKRMLRALEAIDNSRKDESIWTNREPGLPIESSYCAKKLQRFIENGK